MVRVSALLATFAVLLVPISARPQVSRVDPPDLTAAEREIREGRRALEEVVGAELLRAEVPPLPQVAEPSLWEREETLLTRLAETPPESWTAEDRARIEELAPAALELRSALRAEDEPVDVEALPPVGLGLLEAGRTLAVFDRLALVSADETAFVDGLGLRLDLAERLYLQRGALGPLLGAALLRPVLSDIQRAVRRPETSTPTLARMEALLLRFRDRVPDAAAALALEGLLSLEQAEDLPGDLGTPDPAGPLLMAPVAHDFALLAERCRAVGCRRAIEELDEHRERRGEDSNPYRVIADILIPNLLNMAEKLESMRDLTDLALAAVGLRLETAETGAYPVSLEDLPVARAPGSRAAGEWSYGRTAEGGAQVRLAGDALLSAWPEGRREDLRELLTWELPPLSRETDAPHPNR